jgi:hypothetical protein
MAYEKPNLVVVGQASALVLGGLPGDSETPGQSSVPHVVGLDD